MESGRGVPVRYIRQVKIVKGELAVKYRLMRWPAWLRGIVVGVLGGGTAFAYKLLLGTGPGSALVTGAVFGVVFATAVGLTLARAEKALDPARGPALTVDERVRAFQAVDRGQYPDRPRVRAAAVKLARQRVKQRAWIVPSAVLQGFLLLVCVAFAVLENPGWWFLAVLVLLLGPLSVAALRRQHRGAVALLAAVRRNT